MKPVYLFIFIAMLAGFSGVSFAVNIAACTNLNSATTTYVLTADVTYTGNFRCMNVSANGVTLDCAGFKITANNQSSQVLVYALNVNGFTLRNCKLSSGQNDVTFDGANSTSVTNVNITYGTGNGIRFTGNANLVNITDVSISNVGTEGIRLPGNNVNNIIKRATISNSGSHAIEMDSGSNGNIVQDSVFSNSVNDDLRLASVSNNIFSNLSMSGTTRPVWLSDTSDNNTFTNITMVGTGASSCMRIGQSGAPTNTLVNNSILSGCVEGIYIDNNALGVNVTNVHMSSMSGNAIRIAGTTGNRFNNVVVTEPGVAGLLIESTTASNNFTDLNVYSTSGTFISQTAAATNNFYNTTLGYNSSYGSANWTSFTLSSVVTITQGTNIYAKPDFVAVNDSAITPLNSTALIKLNTDPACQNNEVMRFGGLPVRGSDIMFAGGLTGNNASCASGVGSFSVSNFNNASGYALNTWWLGGYNTASPIFNSVNTSSILYITFFDENTLLPLSIDSALIGVGMTPGNNAGPVRNYTITYASAGAIQNATVKAFPDWASANLSDIETYSAAGYTTRSRFLVNANTNLSVTQNIQIYLLPLTSASYGIVHVVRNGEPVSGAYVTILKYFSSTSAYTQIDQKVTDSGGNMATYVDPIAYYKFIVYDSSGNVIFTGTTPQQFICDPNCALTINIGNLNPINLVSPYPVSYCYGNNATNTIVYFYSDATGLTHTINFLAYRENVAAPVCNTTVTGSSGSSNCVLSAPENLTNYLYACQVWITASPPRLNFEGLLDYRVFNGLADWFIPAIAIVVVVACTAGMAAGIGLSAIALFILSALGFLPISIGLTIPIMFVGLAIAYLVSKRGYN